MLDSLLSYLVVLRSFFLWCLLYFGVNDELRFSWVGYAFSCGVSVSGDVLVYCNEETYNG